MVSRFYWFAVNSISGLFLGSSATYDWNTGEEPEKAASWSYILVYEYGLGIKGKCYFLYGFYNAHLTHLASPSGTIECLPPSCYTASLAQMAVSIADTYMPAHTKIDQDIRYSSGREQSSSAEKGESLPMD